MVGATIQTTTKDAQISFVRNFVIGLSGNVTTQKRPTEGQVI